MARKMEDRSRVLGWLAGAVVGGLILAFGALTFTNARNVSDTLEEATALHTVDMTLVAQDVAMKSIGQLVLLAQDRELGVAGAAAVEVAAVEAERAIAALQSRFSFFDEDTSNTLAPALSIWDHTASEVIALARDGEATAAAEKLVSSLAPVAARLAAVMTVERDERAAAVDEARERVGRLVQIAGFLTAFLLPLGAIIVYRISVHRQLEVAEAHLDARLEAERSVGRARDQFIANISQELRAPLTSIHGFSEVLLEQGFVDPAAARDLVGLINSESAELARMAEDFLVAAHDADAPPAMDSSPIAIAEELDAVIAAFQRRGHAIGGTYGSGTVTGDQLRIRQIVSNLVSNAIRHGGPTIRVYGTVAGSNYVVSVEDDGPGVPENLVPRLFSRFVHRGDAPLTAGSAGLGLAVAHLLADAMNGMLEYDRVTGRTSFILSLPLAGETEPDAVAADLLAASP